MVGSLLSALMWIPRSPNPWRSDVVHFSSFRLGSRAAMNIVGCFRAVSDRQRGFPAHSASAEHQRGWQEKDHVRPHFHQGCRAPLRQHRLQEGRRRHEQEVIHSIPVLPSSSLLFWVPSSICPRISVCGACSLLWV